MMRLLSDHVWTVIGVAIAVIALAAAYVFLVTPVYSANVLVRVHAPDPNQLGIAPQGQVVMDQQTPPTDAEISMMQSRTVLEPVMQQFGYDLSVTPREVPVLGLISKKFATPGRPLHPWFGLDSFAWGGERIHIDSLHVPPQLENAKLLLRALDNGGYELIDHDGNTLLTGKVGMPAQGDGISMVISQLDARAGTEFKVQPWNEVDALKRFSGALKIQEKGKDTGVVQIAFESSNPTVAANVANAVAQGYLAATVAEHRMNDTKTLDFINEELPRLREQLRDSESKLTSYQNQAGSLQPTSEAQSYLQGGIDFQRQIAALQLQRTQMLQHFTPNSPPVQNIDAQLAQLNDAKGKFDSRFNSMPASERASADLTRNAKVAESIYVAMVNKAEELTVRRAGTTGDVNIIDSAIRPADPVSPNVPMVMAASAAVGLMLGSLYVFARSRLLTGVTDPHFVERGMSVPVFGSILYSAQQARLDRAMPRQMPWGHPQYFDKSDNGPLLTAERAEPGTANGPVSDETAIQMTRAPLPPASHFLLARSFPHDSSVEALRGVRTALHFNVRDASDNVVVMTGPTPGSGKSFVAANLAVLEAETAKRVLLVDADMRCGRLASMFNQPNAEGLAELLAGRIDIDRAIRPVGVPGLSFVSCGTYPDNPSELLMMPHFRSLLAEFNRRFDLVIIDTPPLLAVSDAAIVAHDVGKTVLVLRSGMQTEEEIEETVTKLERAGAWVVGAVFNAVPLRRSEKRNYSYMSAYSNHNHVAA
ncbi:polysaccharide biosynthesis tyrosine autokinase [Paraburkholderia phosphatilytica]|uniref:polysaccharide biosynthesis tyrosine autokinase n=1 Tax=Paraburkholderia phosphatilytica TaxID=2282883 RepID=UPI000E5407E5|nr:polysaccharide biosynthesis tyrosine autokinase [Paraburkholderia phosphatilytica]